MNEPAQLPHQQLQRLHLPLFLFLALPPPLCCSNVSVHASLIVNTLTVHSVLDVPCTEVHVPTTNTEERTDARQTNRPNP